MINKEKFTKLSAKEQIEFINELKAINKKKREKEKSRKIKPCPFCKSKNISLNGHDLSDLQRFKCKQCKKTFSHRTGTPLDGIKKEKKFKQYYKIIEAGEDTTLAKICEKLNISMSAAFQWRHKINNDLLKKAQKQKDNK